MSGEAVKKSRQSGVTEKEEPLDAQRTLLYEICRLTLKGERIYSDKLKKNLEGRQTTDGRMTCELIARTLSHFQFDGDQTDLVGQKGRTIVRYTGETERGSAGSLYRINDKKLLNVMELYKNHLQKIGKVLVIKDRDALRGSKRRAEYEQWLSIMRQLRSE